MDNIKLFRFFSSTQAKRFYWTILNAITGLLVSWITYLATNDNVAWAVIVLPVAVSISQLITKELNTYFSQPKY
jgi:hypothetical protein